MSLTKIFYLLVTYKYFLLFPIAVIEGPIITVIAGFLTSLGHLNFVIVYCLIVIGDLTGDTMSYVIGRYGGTKVLDRWGHYVGLSVEKVQKFKDHFNNHAAKTIMWGKLAYTMEMPFLIGAGLAKVPYKKFIFYNLIPTLPKSMLFLLIGFYFGKSYVKIDNYLDYAALGTISLAIVLTLIYFFIRKYFKKISNN